MRIFAIDDEPIALRFLHDAIAEAEPEAEIVDFGGGEDVLRALRDQAPRPDVVFSDIELSGMTGLALAVEIKKAAPDARIIFVTGFPKYAADAYILHIDGYILKPVYPDRVREELDRLHLPSSPPETDKLQVQCFGNFEVFWHGKPLLFHRLQTKELLAYLVDRNGAACTSGEIIATLWEDGDSIKNPKQYVRVLVQDLRNTLASAGMEAVLIRERRQLAIRRDLIDCDYYRLLEGDAAAVNAYRGEYMRQYSWAELTSAKLQFQQ